MKIKKVFLISITLTILHILQASWAMGAYFNNLSSNCLDCSIWTELIFDSAIQILVIIPILLICWKFKVKKHWQIILVSIILSGFWLFMNNEIFKDRVSSWTTFLTREEWQATWNDSILPISFYLALFAFILSRILNLKTSHE